MFVFAFAALLCMAQATPGGAVPAEAQLGQYTTIRKGLQQVSTKEYSRNAMLC